MPMPGMNWMGPIIVISYASPYTFLRDLAYLIDREEDMPRRHLAALRI